MTKNHLAQNVKVEKSWGRGTSGKPLKKKKSENAISDLTPKSASNGLKTKYNNKTLNM